MKIYPDSIRITGEHAGLITSGIVPISKISANEGGYQGSSTRYTNFRVKNGNSFVIDFSSITDPSSIVIESGYSHGEIIGNRIKVNKCGTFHFSYIENGIKYYVASHVNYFGELKYPGPDGEVIEDDDQVITITSNEDLHKELGFFGDFGPGMMYFFWQKELDNSENWSFFADENQNIKVMKMSTILEQGFGSKSFRIRIVTNDGTSNSSNNGELLGVKKIIITIRDERPVEVAPTITTESLPDGVSNQAYSQELTATGTSPITWSIASGNLPDGLNLSETGLIAGTPTAAGIFSFVVKATNVIGSDEREISIEIVDPIIVPTITTTTLPDGISNQAYSQELTATGTAPITWSIASGNLPDGLNLSETGLIAGTPSTLGTFTFVVRATNAIGSDEKELNIIINQETALDELNQEDAKIYQVGESLMIENLKEKKELEIYTINGISIYQNSKFQGQLELPVAHLKSSTLIIKIGHQYKKILLL